MPCVYQPRITDTPKWAFSVKNDFLSKRKQDEIPEYEVRTFAVKVMMNSDEINILDSARSSTNLSRAEVIRALIFKNAAAIKKAPIVPEINLQLARDLGRALGNLSTVAGVMRAGKFVELEDARYQVTELQKILRGAK